MKVLGDIRTKMYAMKAAAENNTAVAEGNEDEPDPMDGLDDVKVKKLVKQPQEKDYARRTC